MISDEILNPEFEKLNEMHLDINQAEILVF